MKIIRSAFFYTILLTIIFTGATANASVSVGTIDSANKYTKICQDSSCTDFGNINWKPTINANTPGATAVTITDSSITGHLWGDEIGWINMAPTGAGVTVNPSTGVLSGKAFSNTGSWINFNPTGFGVTLVDNGSGSNFSGWAWVSGPNGGWMKFDCAVSTTCISTDWRTTSYRPSTSTGSSAHSRSSQNLVSVPITVSEKPNPISTSSPLELLSPEIPQTTPPKNTSIFDKNNDGESDGRSVFVNEDKNVEKGIIKLPFIPKSLEIPIRLLDDKKIDLSSVFVIIAIGLTLWKFVINIFIKMLI